MSAAGLRICKRPALSAATRSVDLGFGKISTLAVRAIAEDIVENGMKTPIQVRHDGKRHILVEGLHRLEAMKWLGEAEIDAYLVQARKH